MYDEIEKLCLENGIYDCDPILKRRYSIVNKINCLISFCSSKKVGIRCVSIEAGAIYQIVSKTNKNIISLNNKKLVNRRIQRDVNVIIDYKKDNVSALRKLFIKAVYMTINRCKYINLYDYIKNDIKDSEDEWYISLGYGYENLNLSKIEYENALSKEERIICIKKLIAGFLYIRDFINSELWINRLKEIGEKKDIILYEKLWDNISYELQNIKEKLKCKQHVVVNWIDALRYSELDNMPFLANTLEKGINFNRMYAMTSYTKAAMLTLLYGSRFIDDKLYDIDVYGVEKAPLLDLLENYEYGFKCFSLKFSGGIYSEIGLLQEYGLINSTSPHKHNITPSTLCQYNAILDMSNSSGNNLYIIHNLPETHAPYVSINTPNSIDDYHSSREKVCKSVLLHSVKASQQYLDDQLSYYYNYYGNQLYNIYFSDHGKYLGESYYDIENYNHIVFGITSNKLKSRSAENIYSLCDFGKIINILFENKYEDIFYDNEESYAIIQRDDVYGKLADKYEEGDEEFLDYIVQHRGVVKKNDWYIRYVTGKEIYVSFDNKDDNEKQTRINYLRNITGMKFIDIEKEKKYKKAKDLYIKNKWNRCEDNYYV